MRPSEYFLPKCAKCSSLKLMPTTTNLMPLYPEESCLKNQVSPPPRSIKIYPSSSIRFNLLQIRSTKVPTRHLPRRYRFFYLCLASLRSIGEPYSSLWEDNNRPVNSSLIITFETQRNHPEPGTWEKKPTINTQKPTHNQRHHLFSGSAWMLKLIKSMSMH